ncbi:MAG TPA: SAM-dependent methyltransferase [Pseudomonadales bacterium]|nr:SAM-dependent methyltransferase [Pseudomonadales bacterium]
MLPDRPSRTAEGAALLRAAHAYIDDRPLLFEDHEVRGLLSPASRLALGPLPPAIRLGLRRRERLNPQRAALRGQIVLRARFAEDALEAALSRGVDQVVVLAAGLDTLAIRRPTLLRDCTLYEVDHPATQAWKRRRLGTRGERIRFVPVDFARDALATALVDAGLDPSRPMFVNWLGCTYYLPREAMRGTLAALAEVAAPGSEIALDYWTEHASRSWGARLLLAGIRVAVALQQEPMVGLLSPSALARLAEAAGWSVLEDLDAPAQRLCWLADRRDTLSVPDFAHLARLGRAP